MKYVKPFFLLLFICNVALAQNASIKIDSLQESLIREKTDTNRVKTLVLLAREYRISNINKALELSLEAHKLSTELNFVEGRISACNSLGIMFRRIGEFDSAIAYIEKAIILETQNSKTPRLAVSYNNLGLVYMDLGAFEKAISNFLKAKKAYEAENNERDIAGCLVNIGIIKYHQGDPEKALNYYQQALKVYKELKEMRIQAIILNNMGVIYQDRKENEKALEHFQRSLNKYELAGDKYGVGVELGNIGVLYSEMGRYKEALKIEMQALNLRQEMSDRRGVAQTYKNISSIYQKLGDWGKAFESVQKSMDIAYKINSLGDIKAAENQLALLLEEKGDYKSSLEHFKKYMAVKDTMLNEQNNRAISELEAKYESEKRQKEIEGLNKQSEIDKLELSLKSTQIIGLLVALLVVAILLVLLFFINQKRNKANKLLVEKNSLIEDQKTLIETKNNEIIDSIQYARKIQYAILPDEDIIRDNLPNSFILYLPKDIVSGDFYWYGRVSDHSIFAVADCTGHGVPGAFMSMMANDFLSQIVLDNQVSHPESALKILDEKMTATLKKRMKTPQVHDGLDIALCAYNHKTQMLSYSGAKNPLYVVRNGEFKEFEASRSSIGGQDKASKKFMGFDTRLEKGDVIYIFSDGFADQFGGMEGKKYKYKRFRQFLTAISDLNLQDQEVALKQEFNMWKGGNDQVDDVCIMGVKV